MDITYARVLKADFKCIDALGNIVHATMLEPKSGNVSFYVDKVLRKDGSNALECSLLQSGDIRYRGQFGSESPIEVAKAAAATVCTMLMGDTPRHSKIRAFLNSRPIFLNGKSIVPHIHFGDKMASFEYVKGDVYGHVFHVYIPELEVLMKQDDCMLPEYRECISIRTEGKEEPFLGQTAVCSHLDTIFEAWCGQFDSKPPEDARRRWADEA